MRIRLRATVNDIHSSLFFVPLLFVLGGAALGIVGIRVDQSLHAAQLELPLGRGATVDSARAVLSTVASATITVAGIAFSISLLVFQLASSQYSPRIIGGLFRDPFNKRVMGFVVGTFTYCLVVLRAVRAPVNDGGGAVVPNLSVALALVLGIGSVLAVVGFINHSAHMMEVSQILAAVSGETIHRAQEWWPSEPSPPVDPTPPPEVGFTVTFDSDGWIQQIDESGLLELAPDVGVVRVDAVAGDFAIRGMPLCTIWPAPDRSAMDEVRRRARRATHVGKTRTLDQDVAYGVRQLVDVALRGLSPAVNDPTTAQDAMLHVGAVLRELLVREAPASASVDGRGRRLLRPRAATHEDVVRLAFDQIRRVAAPHPTMSVYLLRLIGVLNAALDEAGQPKHRPLLLEQARLLLAASQQAEALPGDHAAVLDAYRRIRA